MPTYPGTTLSNLKTATEIASNTLFDHAPGTPNAVYYGDFVVNFIGRDINGDYDTNTATDGGGDIPPWDTNLSVPNTNVNGNDSLPSGYDGSLDSSGDFVLSSGTFEVGDIFWVRLDVDCGQYAVEQIVQDQVTINTTRCTVLDTVRGVVSGEDVLDIKLEVDGYDAIALDATYTDGGYNQHAVGYNTPLNFNSTSVEADTPYLQSIQLVWDDTGPNGTGVACDGSTALDNLLGIGSASDDDYGIKVTTSVSDPTDQNSEYWLWVYFDDQNASPPDNSDHLGGQPVEGKTACANFPTQTILPDNSYNVYVYLTTDEAGNNIFADDFISFTPQTGQNGSTSKTFNAP